MSASAARRAIKFMREQFTHLDTQLIQDGNLHLDLFINENNVDDLKGALEERKQNDDMPPIIAHINYDFKKGGRQRVPVEVISYDDETSSFLLANKELGVRTQRPRIYIELDTDNH